MIDFRPRNGSPTARGARATRIAVALACAAVCAAGATCAWFQAFSIFQPYDDEGYFELAIRQLLDGRRLYDDVPTVYGPAYFLVRWVIHALLRVPLSTDGVRWVTLAFWLACAALVAWLVRCTARDRRAATPLALGAGALALYHLKVFTNEPGHVQDLGLLLSLCALACQSRTSNARAFVVGACVGALLLVKVNLGLFLALAVLASFPLEGLLRITLQVPAVVAALVLPWILMRAHLREAWAPALACISNSALLGALVLARRERTMQRDGLRLVLALVCGGVAAFAIVLGFIVARGSSLHAWLESTLLLPLRFTDVITHDMNVPGLGVLSAALGCAAALFARARPATSTRGALDLLRCVFCALVVGGCLVRTELLIPYALPLAWIVLVDRERRAARLPLVLANALLVLQVFPINGSQGALATLTLVPLAFIALDDLCADARFGMQASARAGARRMLLDALRWTPAAAALLLFAYGAWKAQTNYERLDAIELRGARSTHFPPPLGARLRCLADTLAQSPGTFISVSGDNSLYLWADKRPAARVLVSHSWKLFTPEQQAEIAHAHAALDDLIVIDRPGRIEPELRTALPFFQLLRTSFRRVARLDEDEILVRANASTPDFASCALFTASELASAQPRLELRLPAGRTMSEIARVQVFSPGAGTAYAADSAAADGAVRATLLADERAIVLSKAPPAARAPLLRVRCFDARGKRILTLPVVVLDAPR